MRTAFRLARAWPFCAAFLVALVPATLQAQQAAWIKVSSAEAQTHLVKKVEPVYPAFAKAAGVQGTVHIHIGINLDGRIGAIEEETGPPSLIKSAENAIRQYVWRPFHKDGHPVAANTAVDVVFQLPGNVPPPTPPPPISWHSFSTHPVMPFCDDCLEAVRPQLRRWLAADLKKEAAEMEDGSESSAEFLSVEKALSEDNSPLPEQIELIQVPVAKPGVRLYLFRLQLAIWCGDGNCPAELIEQRASGIRSVLKMGGGAFYMHPRSDSPYPDIFTYWHMSAFDGGIAGYRNVDGLWGQLYCGEIRWSKDQSKETDAVRVCQ